MGGSRAIRNPAYALDSLYEGLGITPQIYARHMSEDDYDADATVDYRTTRTFDANGNRTMQEYDSNADGTADSRTTYTNQLVNGWMYYYWD